MNKTVIIQASSRSKGDTFKIVNHIVSNHDFAIIDLNTKNIKNYDYDYKNQDDDFLEVIKDVIKNYDTIIFATPIYWYTMSGLLKVFFDRISDLIRIHKDIGRKLRGKSMAIISVSNHDDLKDGFIMPFKESANYLGMNYLGSVHSYFENDEINEKVSTRISDFISNINGF